METKWIGIMAVCLMAIASINAVSCEISGSHLPICDTQKVEAPSVSLMPSDYTQTMMMGGNFIYVISNPELYTCHAYGATMEAKFSLPQGVFAIPLNGRTCKPDAFGFFKSPYDAKY